MAIVPMDDERKLGEKLKMVYEYDAYKGNDKLHAVHCAIKMLYGNGYYMTCSLEKFKTYFSDIRLSIDDHLMYLDTPARRREMDDILEEPSQTLAFLHYLG